MIRHLFSGILLVSLAHAGEIILEPNQFVRGEFMNPTNAAALIRENNILCGSRTNWVSLTGKLEWDVTVPKTGWYAIHIPGHAWGIEMSVDAEASFPAGGGHVNDLWLIRGQHTLRAQRWHWTGFQKTESILLKPIDYGVQIRSADQRTVIRTSESLKLAVQSGGCSNATRVAISFLPKEGSSVQELIFAPSKNPETKTLEMPFQKEGIYHLMLTVNGRPLAQQDVQFSPIAVVDTQPVQRGGEWKRTLIQEIDCTSQEPPYSGEGGTSLQTSTAGRYRESGDQGFLRAQHQKKDCSWFAYAFRVPEQQVPYMLEVDYPDDAFRTFCMAIREGVPGTYPVTAGVDSGECYSLSGKMQTQAILFWPKSKDLRAVFVTAHDGRRGAAAARIRIYKIDGELPVPTYQSSPGRTFANWYEEGSNFMALYGAPDKGSASVIIGAERWARTIAWLGGNLLVPTVSVYQMGLYPSRYNINFCEPFTFDAVRVIVMKCEKYGLGFVGEFHPECRELDWLGDPTRQQIPRPNEMLSKDGKSGKTGEAPRFSPLHPANRAWYLGMLEEFARRYADTPAFKGISLRLMTWANPGLNNFHSLDWGYDDFTLALFEKETGIRVPSSPDASNRFHARYDWLCTHAKAQWIAWRCQKIAEIYRDICACVRKVRPDLVVYSDVFTGFENWQEAGLDPALLTTIEGLQMVQADSSYGRRAYTYRGPLADAKLRDSLIDPKRLLGFDSEQSGNAFLFGAGYFEATEVVIPPEALGYPAGTPRTWMSGVVNPAGRHYLERYALALAEGDARYLSDGGNAYTVGQQELHDFLAVFRQLPAVRFRTHPEAIDPITVREYRDATNLWFYAVNRERYPVTLTLSLSGKDALVRLRDGASIHRNQNELRLILQPYELAGFKTTCATQILELHEEPPEQAKESLRILLEDAHRIQARTASVPLAHAIIQAEAAVQAGHLWRARTVLETSDLIDLYQKTKQFPRGLYACP